MTCSCIWSWFLVAAFEINNRAKSYSSLTWNVLEYLALFLIVMLHEYGHALACRQVGGTANHIVLWPLGGVAYVNPPPRPGAMLWSIAAGPLANVALLALVSLLGTVNRSLGLAGTMPNAHLFLRALWVTSTPQDLDFYGKLDVQSGPVHDMILDLVRRHVAVTSTLPVFEMGVPGRPSIPQRVLDALAPDARSTVLANKVRASYLAALRRRYGTEASPWPAAFKKEMEFERAFSQAGGLLLAGLDPTGMGGVVAGFGDQREVERLVETGFTPLEAIHIATANGAQYLGELDRIGTIAPDKQADLVVRSRATRPRGSRTSKMWKPFSRMASATIRQNSSTRCAAWSAAASSDLKNFGPSFDSA